MKRNTVVLFIVLAVLSTLAWAGWANYEYRKQALERAHIELDNGNILIADSSGAIPTVASPLTGKPAPAFTLPDTHGKKVSLSSYRGKAVLINFWATWCGPCKLETPWIVDLRNRYASQGFEVLGISADDLDKGDKPKLATEIAAIQHFADSEHISYPVLIDGESIGKAYGGIDSLPQSFFIDRTGKVVAATDGLASKSEIEANIRKALGVK